MKANDFENQEAIASIFNNITEGDSENGFAFIDHAAIFNFTVKKDDDEKDNFEVTRFKFIVAEKAQFYLEIFYEPFFQDLEVTLISPDASNVRSHLKSLETYSDSDSSPKIDWSLFKGSKKIFVEVETGTYDILIS